MCSTPIRLDVFEDSLVQDAQFDANDLSNFNFQEEGLPLFDGAHSSTENFMSAFETIADKHKMSKLA